MNEGIDSGQTEKRPQEPSSAQIRAREQWVDMWYGVRKRRAAKIKALFDAGCAACPEFGFPFSSEQIAKAEQWLAQKVIAEHRRAFKLDD